MPLFTILHIEREAILCMDWRSLIILKLICFAHSSSSSSSVVLLLCQGYCHEGIAHSSKNVHA